MPALLGVRGRRHRDRLLGEADAVRAWNGL
jgi:hypothetical protein